MLQVGIHHAQNLSIRVLPSIKDCAGETSLSFAHQKSHARIFASDGRDHCAGPIRAVIVDDQNLVGMIEWIENGTNVAEQAADVFLFTESGNYQGQLFPQLRRRQL